LATNASITARAISAAGGGMVAPEPPSSMLANNICMVVK
jgi:hypothetical protein